MTDFYNSSRAAEPCRSGQKPKKLGYSWQTIILGIARNTPPIERQPGRSALISAELSQPPAARARQPRRQGRASRQPLSGGL